MAIPTINESRRSAIFHVTVGLLTLLTVTARAEWLQSSSSLPAGRSARSANPTTDWLIRPRPEVSQLARGADSQTVVIGNGIVSRTFRIGSAAGTVGIENLAAGNSILRGPGVEAEITLNGQAYRIGALAGQPDRAYLTDEWIVRLTNASTGFEFRGFAPSQVVAPLHWEKTRHHANLPWPPPGVAVDFLYAGNAAATAGIEVTVHYEVYDGLPVIGKWISITNRAQHDITLDRFAVERLPVVEAEAAVDERPGTAWRTPPIDVLSDYMFHGMDLVTGNAIASWATDPEFRTQVSYAYKTPCVLLVQPPIGPGTRIPQGGDFRTFRTYLVVHDSTDRERQGLTLRHAERALAPWMSENPVMMHVRNADSVSFRRAVDQCAETGFEMIIYTFGSGLDMENGKPEYMAKVKADVDYAHSKGIQVGGYSLFSSRSVGRDDDVISPETGKPGGAIFGNAPCFGSRWGLNYFRQLTNFIATTGFDLLEHDGPYPGDVCASTNHPGHHGLADSQWVNWSMNARLYTWCREHGVYVNQPDYYFLAGGSKSGMGYREDNWSLPRAQQLIHARQNIFDGTWTKPQTAGWMFVPLTEYQGGGAAATIEPLHEHLADYEGHLANCLGSGVQACWRGPRLYDTEETKQLVKKWVGFFKEHRDILESDIIHCRRADGRDIDYVVHVNPLLKQRAFAMIHNPLDHPVERTVLLPLYYAGLEKSALIREQNGKQRKYDLDRQNRAFVPVTIPAKSRTWLVVEQK